MNKARCYDLQPDLTIFSSVCLVRDSESGTLSWVYSLVGSSCVFLTVLQATCWRSRESPAVTSFCSTSPRLQLLHTPRPSSASPAPASTCPGLSQHTSFVHELSRAIFSQRIPLLLNTQSPRAFNSSSVLVMRSNLRCSSIVSVGSYFLVPADSRVSYSPRLPSAAVVALRCKPVSSAFPSAGFSAVPPVATGSCLLAGCSSSSNIVLQPDNIRSTYISFHAPAR